ncbi:DNA polymerase III PolC-type [Rubripirellula tenax]|uniref:DNA polymerase III PolC-type n=1 Tax=Rubripirellula tenax TaxID=2528015 RepID=A0A5C6EPP4_9BACT|nr:exonuclease domain-containing protein [Rubripirellula tenax]TWU51082.1 DNA polymerase III PolC-type [Rubripirellula tenax]
MEFSADFTAIDFETANRRRDSACQLAAVVVRGGRIVDQAMWMIRPEPLYFSRGNIEIHGITPAQVRGESVFGDHWPDIAAKLGDDCLVAHNASFDIGVMIACLQQVDHPVPDLSFTCTRAVARRTWPHRPRFGLKPLAEWLGIRFRHHDALEDSIACAKIMMAAGIDREATSLTDLEKRLNLNRGRAGEWGYRGPRAGSASRRRPRAASAITRRADPPSSAVGVPFLYPGQDNGASVADPSAQYATATAAPIDIQRMMVRAEFIRPLAGQRFVLTGRLDSMTREEAELLATRLGGECQAGLDETTDLWIQGQTESSTDPHPVANANSIRTVTETEFLEFVISPTRT